MADNRNFAALDWLIHEIGETLKEARQALEAYVENPKDTVRIRFCLTHIHQVHGSLQMVEFFGAAMLAEEMERLTQAMIQGSVSNAGEAQEVLMRAILQFPVYLDQVKTSRKDNPLVVLPLLNDLRAVRGESLLTDTKLFVPNLAPSKKIIGPKISAVHDNVQFQSMALKLRQMYQYAAAGFIRSVNSDENLAYLQKVFNRLHKLTQGTARHALWDICLALAEALEMDAIEISVAIKNILRQLDKEIKILAVHGTKALNSYTNDELIKNLLYYVARAGKHAPGFTPGSHLKRIYETYNLADALIEGRETGDDNTNMLSSPDAEAMRSVVEALKTEINFIRHALDVCLSGGDGQQALQEALPVVKRIADTMAVLGFGDLRKQVLEQGAALQRAVSANSEMSNEQLMSIAGKVIEIEDALDSLAQQQMSSGGSSSDSDINLSRAKESVLRESRNGLEHAKDAIIEYIASQWDRTRLQNVPETLREIRGGLEIMPLPRAARILGACARYIEEQLLAQEFTPQWSTLDTLADAITSVEYYLERLSGGSTKEENELLLGVAEESVAALGYPVAKTPRAEIPGAEFGAVRQGRKEDVLTTHEAAEKDEANLTAAYESILQPEPPKVQSEPPKVQPEPPREPPSLLRSSAPSIGNHYPRPETTVVVSPALNNSAGVAIATLQQVSNTNGDTFKEDAFSEKVFAGTDESDAEEISAELPHAFDSPEEIISDEITATGPEEIVLEVPVTIEPVVSIEKPANAEQAKNIGQTAAPEKAAYDDEEDDIDEEIIEIFVEEAREVSETIAEYFPIWAKDFNDSEALTEFRRAFHTLKGSGRMVGANDIGELAWSIENMLNRVIDKTIEPANPHLVIIEKVRSLLPSMIDAFSVHQPNPNPSLSQHYRLMAESLAKGVVPAELADAPDAFSHVATPVSVATKVVAEEDDDEDIYDSEDNEVSDENLTAAELDAAQSEHELPIAFVEEESAATEDDIGEDDRSADDSNADEEEIANLYAAYKTEPVATPKPVESDDDGDVQLWDIFGAEALTHLQVVEEFIAHMEAEAPCYETPSDGIQRALHTLKGSAHMAEIAPIAELAAPLEKFVKELRSYHVNINDDILQLLRDGVSYTHAGLAQIERGETVEIPRLHQFVARVNELRELYVTPLVSQQEMDEHGKRPVDPELLSIFMAEEMNLLLNADNIIAQWQEIPHNTLLLQPVLDELHNLTRGANHAYLPVMASLGEKLERVYTRIISRDLPYSLELCDTLNAAHVALLDMVDAVAAGQNLSANPETIHAALDEFLAQAVNAQVVNGDAVNEPAVNEPAVNEQAVNEQPLSTQSFDNVTQDSANANEFEVVANNTEIENIDFADAIPYAEKSAYDEVDLAEFNAVENITFDNNVDDISSLHSGTNEIAAEEISFESSDMDLGEEIDFGSIEVAEENIIDALPLAETEETSYSELASYTEISDADTEDEIIAEPVSEFSVTHENDVSYQEINFDEVRTQDEKYSSDEATLLVNEAEEAEFIEEAELIDYNESSLVVDTPDDQIIDEAEEEIIALDLPATDIDDAEEADFIVEPHALFEADSEDDEIVIDDVPEVKASEVSEHEVEENFLGDDEQNDADAEEETPLFTTANDTKRDAPVAARRVEEISDDFDPEIVEIFLEEAGELLEEIERALHEWQEDWNNAEPVEELKRYLHTFKGGARLAGLTELGDLSHNFETQLIEMSGNADLDQAFFRQFNTYQDRMHAGVDIARERLNGEFVAEDNSPDDLDETVDEAPIKGSTTYEEEYEAGTKIVPAAKPTLIIDNTERLAPTDPNQKPNVFTFAPKPKPAPAPLPKIPGSEFSGGGGIGGNQVQHLAARRAGPQEVVKVSAELLEELVNLAGETSISRGRMEQQVSDLGGAIEEMDSTIHRLQEQLRRLDIETEAQVLFRQEQMMQHEEFDPLEMDRYSQLQQLSRSLIESASDLMDLKYTLADKTRDTETLLLQQSRINTDLQEGLMRSRMVPFSRLVPRLRRIVRQAATELGKDVDFELDNVEGELDRTVLERMVAPLEHMLRNAVDHGIESPEARAAAGKPAIGRIILSLGREGGDVTLRLADDGRGINLQRVREKAIERGLMAEDAPLSDQDLMQFILHAGFSTADKVTQISGRGVGMDVVHSEIKQLGGAMFIDSRWGEGTEFTIRLPFTVSVNRALMVQIGDDLYAIPLNTIEGIVRVSPFELEHYYQDENARFDYAGENYLVRYLGTMLDSDATPKLDGQALPLPVILVRSTENTVALQVDRLLGSREIVVKTLGAQFSAVHGVSGATVTGDGSVVVILDLHALIREQLALGLGRAMLLDPFQTPVIQEEELVEKIVMVVDDSVTVRKVTSRFLEREGFRVIAAKDGVEALQLLQDHIPDVMLLDIEMPRMDGFEVAKNIRTSSRLRDIPIIMITSRTGEKHRDRAFELGVNKYMGKPYQEDLLLANINELVKKPVK